MSKKKIEHALIMAAGRGIRMMPLTEDLPKPMVMLDGSTLISKGIDFLKDHIKNIHITVGYKGNLVAEHVINKGVNSIFNTDGKGNSWWIYNTLIKHLDEPLLLLTCDNIVEMNIGLLTEEYYKLGAPACLLVPIPPVKGLDGDYIFQENNIVSELSRNKPTNIYCSGIQILNPTKINQITNPTENFYDLWNELIQQKQLFCSNIYPSKWTAIDTVDQLNNLSNGLL